MNIKCRLFASCCSPGDRVRGGFRTEPLPPSQQTKTHVPTRLPISPHTFNMHVHAGFFSPSSLPPPDPMRDEPPSKRARMDGIKLEDPDGVDLPAIGSTPNPDSAGASFFGNGADNSAAAAATSAAPAGVSRRAAIQASDLDLLQPNTPPPLSLLFSPSDRGQAADGASQQQVWTLACLPISAPSSSHHKPCFLFSSPCRTLWPMPAGAPSSSSSSSSSTRTAARLLPTAASALCSTAAP